MAEMDGVDGAKTVDFLYRGRGGRGIWVVSDRNIIWRRQLDTR